MKDWVSLAEMYFEGAITHHQFANEIFEALDETNIQEFLRDAPEECVEMMDLSLAKQPVTDEEWDRMVICGMEWKEEWTKPTIALQRRGVEAVRKYYKEL
jgi:hypothetical protein